MKASVKRVDDALRDGGLETEIVEFAESTRTAAEAAAAIGTTVEQIVKSLVFAVGGNRPVLVLISGTQRVDPKKLAAQVGEPVGRATAEQVREWTGFAIGGVAPVGYASALPTYVDRSLLSFAEVWAAAGTPNAVFRVAPHDLIRISGGIVADLAADGNG